ncbi:MAG: NAD(P)H-dependent oxidoreductase [Planctomycetota bacterium]|mgnify:CR=1 FL=1
MALRVLVVPGSLRADSWNRKLAGVAADAVRAAGGEATLVNLRDFDLPMFDEDCEKAQGMPEGGKKLKELFATHPAHVYCSPEYNSSISGVLKNAIDWASRGAAGEPPLVAFRGKVAALLSTSPGALGGLRGLVHLRSILGNIGVLVLPDQVAVMKSHEAFDAQGQLKDARQAESVKKLAAELVRTASRLTS